MILIVALIDVLGIASILPFIALLSNPEVINSNIVLIRIFEFSKQYGIQSVHEFKFLVGFLVLIIFISGIILKAITTYATIRFTKMREYSIGKLLVQSYLRQPYSWFLNRNSADLGKAILSEAGIVAGDGIKPLIDLMASSLVVISIIILLLLVDVKLALVIGFIFCSIYGFIFILTRAYLNKIGEHRLKNNQLRYTTIAETFGASKEIKIGGLEKIYIKNFSQPAEKYGKTQTTWATMALLPRFVLEALAFGGIMLLVLFLMIQKGSFENALPIISLYILAGYRLMPAIQNVYATLTSITFVTPSLNLLYEDLKNFRSTGVKNENKQILKINDAINLKNINFIYPKSSKIVIKDVNLKINSKTSIGLVGPTGCGKTTLVDIILGLLQPQTGSLEIDGKEINDTNLSSWQSSIGYVPQNIFLADDTIAANIAFGTNPKNINMKLVENASKIANLHDFIVKELPNKYKTSIGERGIRLSGGQKQRIGIARALYHNPQILILDEATSALDDQTQLAVMDAINNLRKDITIILIAHRLSTLKKCDKIVVLEEGKIKKEVSYNELGNVKDYLKNKNFVKGN